jgi:biopolymer transport protein ExbD
MARRRAIEEPLMELNLAPIMNMVMILIPLLLLSTVFVQTGVINVAAPSSAMSSNPSQTPPPEQVQVPKVVLALSSDGVRIANRNPGVAPEAFARFSAPVEGCPGGSSVVTDVYDAANTAPTVCLRDDVGPDQPLVNRINWSHVYNRLVEIRLQPQWFERFAEEDNDVVSIFADQEVEFEMVVRAMDVARYMVSSTADLAEPTASATIASYLLGGGNAPAPDAFDAASYLRRESGAQVTLFPTPILLAPRSTGN